MNLLTNITIFLTSLFYIGVGVKHFMDPNWFLIIIPPYLKFIGIELVYISGIFEILFGFLILLSKYRKIAGYGIILLLLAVYPANIYLAFNKDVQNLIGISQFMALWVRLPIQFVLIFIVYSILEDKKKNKTIILSFVANFVITIFLPYPINGIIFIVLLIFLLYALLNNAKN